MSEIYSLYGDSPTGTKLLRVFLAASIIDNGGKLPVSRRALSDLSDEVFKHRGFQILATQGEDNDLDLTLEWYD
jgi:hypothetical protein